MKLKRKMKLAAMLIVVLQDALETYERGDDVVLRTVAEREMEQALIRQAKHFDKQREQALKDQAAEFNKRRPEQALAKQSGEFAVITQEKNQKIIDLTLERNQLQDRVAELIAHSGCRRTPKSHPDAAARKIG